MSANVPSIGQETGAVSLLATAPHRIGAVTLVVQDLDRVADFYEAAIGLRRLARDGARVTLGTAGRPLLVLRHEPTARRWSQREAGLFHTAFLLPSRADLGAWLQHMMHGRFRLAGAANHIVSEAVYLADPEGNGIEVYADRAPSTWIRTADGVAMSTEALDIQGVRDAATAPWAGMPAEGCIGHVHLQSGDLSRASVFYADLLGFGVTARYPGALFYGSGGYHHQLATNIWNSRGAGPRDDLTTGLLEVELVISGDDGDLHRRFEAASVPLVPTETGFQARDPWGTLIRLTR